MTAAPTPTTSPAAPHGPSELFIALLQAATSRVPEDKMRLDYLDSDGERQTRSHERTYCYALSSRTEQLVKTSQDLDVVAAAQGGFALSVELEKRRSYINPDPAADEGWRTPDLLWHVPGQHVNGVIVEVKRAEASLAEMRRDLEKISTFLNPPASYKEGALLVFGRLSERRISNLKAAAQDHQEQSGHSVTVLHHAEAGTAAVQIWPEAVPVG